ncbi:putative isochorismatase family hydrolase [Rhexocercosporidium sp. MPI-PUGE-AT-0058]|nr:putative isochorismatase family hydrolase [Rhexocercosporidium sp. MPI-PUGE-AT-0058]
MTDHSHTALILVDSQIGALSSPTNFWGPSRSTPSYEPNISKLLTSFRSIPKSPTSPQIIHIYHRSTNPLSPLHPSSPGINFHPSSLPQGNEPVFSKSTNSAFITRFTPELEAYLKEKEVWRIYFVGLSVDLCLGSTVRSACDLGVADHVDVEGRVVKGDLVVVEDAVAAWAKRGGKFDAETVCAVHVESLKGEYARAVKVADVLAEMGLEDV